MFPHKKSLGQNFLVDEEAIEQILSRIRKVSCHSIVEVGPGLGALTEGLKLLPAKLHLVELDDRLAQKWKEEGESVFHEDVLKLDFQKLPIQKPTLLAGNLPYQVASRLIIDRSLGPDTITEMIVMVQKEVAQKVQAPPSQKNYGILSVLAQTFWKVKKIIEVPPRCFDPPPQVAGRVLHFQRLSNPPEIHRLAYLKFLKQAFAQRRKKLINNLGGGLWIEAFKELGFNESIRAEELTVSQWVSLFEKRK